VPAASPFAPPVSTCRFAFFFELIFGLAGHEILLPSRESDFRVSWSRNRRDIPVKKKMLWRVHVRKYEMLRTFEIENEILGVGCVVFGGEGGLGGRQCCLGGFCFVGVCFWCFVGLGGCFLWVCVVWVGFSFGCLLGWGGVFFFFFLCFFGGCGVDGFPHHHPALDVDLRASNSRPYESLSPGLAGFSSLFVSLRQGIPWWRSADSFAFTVCRLVTTTFSLRFCLRRMVLDPGFLRYERFRACPRFS